MSEDPSHSRAHTVDVPADRAGQRLDNFLMAQLSGVPRSVIYRIIRTGQVRVNGGRAKPFRKLEDGDRVRIPPLRTRGGEPARVPEEEVASLEAAVIFEDENLLALDKPAGMAVHGGSGIRWGVIDAFRQSRPAATIELVHRLDRDTSGCLLLAKNVKSLRMLHDQFRSRSTRKGYLALLDGLLGEERIVVDRPLAGTKRSGERLMQVDPAGKRSVTEFQRLQAFRDATYVEASPLTGRTHQIRAHAAFLGAPCAGDERYLDNARLKLWRKRCLKRLFLHAHTLEFSAPGGRSIHLSCPLPDELRAVLDVLQGLPPNAA